jgi:hypothetical protein
MMMAIARFRRLRGCNERHSDGRYCRNTCHDFVHTHLLGGNFVTPITLDRRPSSDFSRERRLNSLF